MSCLKAGSSTLRGGDVETLVVSGFCPPHQATPNCGQFSLRATATSYLPNKLGMSASVRHLHSNIEACKPMHAGPGHRRVKLRQLRFCHRRLCSGCPTFIDGRPAGLYLQASLLVVLLQIASSRAAFCPVWPGRLVVCSSSTLLRRTPGPR
ncbi:unnamed protein product [Symbiodinium natans]|uniref:Uncharacterized protein n=1 Tax=Symbiodinium natans TaxID=878477 RepID=A0A812TEG5_9DINO|nr:unnamed protein product [Symbiodinium natans]